MSYCIMCEKAGPAKWKPLSNQEWALHKIPWMDRDFDTHFVSNSVLRWCEAFKVRSESASNFGYLVVTGGSGSGKTRFGRELPRLLRSQLQNQLSDWLHLEVFTILQEPDDLDDLDSSSTTLPQIAENKAELWFVQELARKHGVDYLKSQWMVLWEVLEAVRQVNGIAKGEPLAIWLQIDEFQTDLNHCSHFLARLASILTSDNSPLRQTNTYIIPILTGTWTLPPIEHAPHLTSVNIPLAGFNSLQQAEEFFLQAWRQEASKKPSKAAIADPPYLDAVPHLRLLKMVGFFPKLIELYAKVRFERPKRNLTNPYQFEEVWLDLIRTIRAKYRKPELLPFDELTREHLLCLWYFRIPVSASYKLNTMTISDARLTGFFSTKPADSSSDDKFNIYIPMAMVCIWMPILFDRECFIPGMVHRRPLSELVLSFHLLTYRMLGLFATVKKKLSDPAHIEVEYRIKDEEMEVQTTRRQLYADAAEGPRSALDEKIWINPNIKWLSARNSGDKKKPKGAATDFYEKTPRHKGPTALTPHALEQHKADQHYSITGIPSGKSITGPELAREIEKIRNVYPKAVVTVITPKKVTGVKTLEDGLFIEKQQKTIESALIIQTTERLM